MRALRRGLVWSRLGRPGTHGAGRRVQKVGAGAGSDARFAARSSLLLGGCSAAALFGCQAHCAGLPQGRDVEPRRVDAAADVARSVQWCLHRLRSPATIDALKEPDVEAMLAHDEADVRWAACRALGRLGEDGRVFAGAVSALLDDSDVDVRIAACRALASTGAAGHFSEALAGRLEDPSPHVRWAACLALSTPEAAAIGHGGAAPWADRLAALLQKGEPSPLVRAEACTALAAGGGLPRWQATIGGMLQDEDEDVRRRAETALGASAAGGA